jgi:hypothetical protein
MREKQGERFILSQLSQAVGPEPVKRLAVDWAEPPSPER